MGYNLSILLAELTLFRTNILMVYTPSQCYSVNLQPSNYKHVFRSRVKNSVNPDQIPSLEAS